MSGEALLQDKAIRELSEATFREKISEVHTQTDRMFAYVMVFEYFLGIAFAFFWSPRTWSGATESVHPHVWSAIILGGLLASFPIYLAIKSPGAVSTRYVIAVTQGLFSALLIHLSGGRIETHFHVFGSLAFLSCYRDWRVLVLSSFVVATDHIARGIWFPLSIYGVASDSTWRFVEHAAWVVFEDSFLIVTCVRGVQDLRGKALRQAELELAKKGLELARDEAQRANQAKSDFLSRVSHELRTPLNSVLGFSQILQMDGLTEDQSESVSMISEGGKHLLKLIDEILDIAGIESGRMTISNEPINVAEVVREVRSMVQPLMLESGITFVEPDIPEETFAIADHQRLKQVLLNLVSNAIKYNVAGGEVRVSVQREEDQLKIFVADTGVGIPEEKRALLFNPFERLGAENSSVQGTGLGLSLSKNLTEAMGGSLSLAPSEIGTCFCMELAAASSPLSTLGQTVLSDFMATMRKGREATILLIEDNPANVQLVERILKAKISYRLVVARDGQSGLDMAMNCNPDIILLDLDLPDIYGGELLKRFRAGAVKAGTPIVIVTADSSAYHRTALSADSATEILTKPIHVQDFLGLIDDLCMGDLRMVA